MSKKGKQLEPKFGLDMPFDEAMQRFMQADPKQVDASIARSKQKKPIAKKKKPGGKKAPPGNASQSPNVIVLRNKRKH